MKLGCMQTLRVIKKVDFGVYLADKDQAKAEERVLLPKKQVPDQTIVGDETEVFLYRDSKDRMIATTTHPFITLNEIAVLTVKEVGRIGAFWIGAWKKTYCFRIRSRPERCMRVTRSWYAFILIRAIVYAPARAVSMKACPPIHRIRSVMKWRDVFMSSVMILVHFWQSMTNIQP